MVVRTISPLSIVVTDMIIFSHMHDRTFVSMKKYLLVHRPWMTLCKAKVTLYFHGQSPGYFHHRLTWLPIKTDNDTRSSIHPIFIWCHFPTSSEFNHLSKCANVFSICCTRSGSSCKNFSITNRVNFLHVFVSSLHLQQYSHHFSKLFHWAQYALNINYYFKLYIGIRHVHEIQLNFTSTQSLLIPPSLYHRGLKHAAGRPHMARDGVLCSRGAFWEIEQNLVYLGFSRQIVLLPMLIISSVKFQ